MKKKIIAFSVLVVIAGALLVGYTLFQEQPQKIPDWDCRWCGDTGLTIPAPFAAPIVCDHSDELVEVSGSITLKAVEQNE